MKQPVKMPALSDTMESGRLLRWLKQPGDAVEKGEAVAEIETDKAVMEMETFHSGMLIGPLADEDKEYPVGETLAWIGDEASEEAEKAKEAKETEGKQAEERAGPGAEKPAEESKRPATGAMPAAQQLEPAAGASGAQEPERKAPDARKKPGATPRVSSAVLEQALVGRASSRPRERSDENAALLREIESGPPFQIEPQRQLRRVIAATMSRAVETPQFRIGMQSDLSPIKSYADAHDASFTLLLARACALTVQEQPDFNAAWTPDGLARRERVDVGIAMEAENGLLTPVVRDVAGRPFPRLAEDWRALKQKIRHHRALPEDFRGATFYLSNLGMFPGIVQFDAVIPPGAAAILAVAAPGDKGTLLTLTCDHRVVFGADAARFLAALAERLGRPGE
ncbi:MAG: 2-oxo acid dehydrogenase subunit E2 [Thiobacillus sp.]|nr:2-oxo acid dehydrogenase subunit E2 [Thiobacillus sp.]